MDTPISPSRTFRSPASGRRGPAGRLVVAIGDQALDLAMALAAGWGSELAESVRQCSAAPSLNALAARPPEDWTAVRLALSDA